MKYLKEDLEIAQKYVKERGTNEGYAYAFGYLENAVETYIKEDSNND